MYSQILVSAFCFHIVFLPILVQKIREILKACSVKTIDCKFFINNDFGFPSEFNIEQE